MQQLLQKIKAFFGFQKAPVVPVRLRPAEQLEHRLASLPPADAVKEMQQLQSGVEQVLAKTTTFAERDEQLELLFWIARALRQRTLGVDFAYEELLGKCTEAYAKEVTDGEPLLKSLDQYIQQFEEHIYLTEATGQYLFRISENKRFVQLPFLGERMQKSARRKSAQAYLDKLATRSYALPFFELGEQVPWLPLSFIDFMAQARTQKMVFLTDGVGYYVYAQNK